MSKSIVSKYEQMLTLDLATVYLAAISFASGGGKRERESREKRSLLHSRIGIKGIHVEVEVGVRRRLNPLWN